METTCPHCGKAITLVGASDLDKDYGLNGNRLQYARDSGRFPEPWLKFGNRNIYLKSDVEAYMQDRAQEGTEKAIQTLQAMLDSLPPSEAKKALESLSRPSRGK
jgi:hypothetical protein